MARSTMLALLVLALIQAARVTPYGWNKIINDAADGALRVGLNMIPTVEENIIGEKYKRRNVHVFECGDTIYRPPVAAYLYVDKDNHVTVMRETFERLAPENTSSSYLATVCFINANHIAHLYRNRLTVL
ncbi:unnamed protein product [Mortierella alpina]